MNVYTSDKMRIVWFEGEWSVYIRTSSQSRHKNKIVFKRNRYLTSLANEKGIHKVTIYT
jgi:hypothetical protein